MTATDELRRMLDEAGVEWDYGITGTASTKFNANGVELTFIDMRDGVTCSTILTPAQAIAATIGRGTLTAEQVSNATYAHSIHADCVDADWQAIADELNDTLGRGTCKIHDCEGSFSTVNRPVWRCDCGAFMTQYTDATTYHKPRFCPNCGRRCVG